MRRPKPGELVLVEWVDARSPHNGWTDGNVALARVRTVGWVVRWGRRKVVVAGEKADAGVGPAPFANVTAIPRGCVVLVELL